MTVTRARSRSLVNYHRYMRFYRRGYLGWLYYFVPDIGVRPAVRVYIRHLGKL